MKKALSILLALVLCAALAAPAFADQYGELTVSGLTGCYETTELTITFEAARLDRETLTFIDWDEQLRTYEDLAVITVRPGSAVTVRDSATGDRSSAWPYLLVDGRYTECAGGMEIASGTIGDWKLNELYSNSGSVIGLLCLLGADSGETCYVRLGEAGPKVTRTNQTLKVNGETETTEIYNIDDKNYFKLRDIAMLLNGTGSQFSVGYDPASKTIAVTTGEAYVPVGGELEIPEEDKSGSCVVSSQSLTIDGEPVALTAYNLAGNNFFGLRELGEALGFDVTYDPAERAMLVTSR